MPDISDFAHHPPAEATSAPDPSLNVPTPARTAGIKAPLPGKPGTVKATKKGRR